MANVRDRRRKVNSFGNNNDPNITSVLESYNGQTYDVKLRGRRFYRDGCWNTFCPPFTLNSVTGTIFEDANDYEKREINLSTTYQLQNKETHESTTNPYKYKTGVYEIGGKKCLLLFFEESIGIEAGKPIIVKWNKPDGYDKSPASYDFFNPIFSNVTIDNSDPSSYTSHDDNGSVTFQGIYTPLKIDYADRSILFVGAANTLYYPSGAGTVSLNSFRAYFKLNNGYQMAANPDGSSAIDEDEEFVPTGGGNVKTFVIDLEDSEATAIQPVEQFERTTNRQTIYDLSGRRVTGDKLLKGIYIVNGRKEVLK